MVLLSALLHGQDQPSGARWFAGQEEVELSELLDLCSKVFEIPLDYDPEDVQGSVQLRTGSGITDEGLWALTNRLLSSRGLACIQAAGEDSLGIVPLDRAASLARLEGSDLAGARAGFIKVLRHLQGAEVPRSLQEALKGVLSGTGSLVQAIPDSGQLILAGPKPQVLEALRLLEPYDRPLSLVEVEEIDVHHLPPTAVVALMERIAASITKLRKDPPRGQLLANPNSNRVIVVAPGDELFYWRSLVEQFDQTETSYTRNYVPRRFGLEETARLIEDVLRGGGEPTPRWKLIRDKLTDTLILTAPHSVHEEVEALLGRLETTAPDTRRSLRAFSIRHRDVDEILELLQSLLADESLGAVSAQGEDIEPQSPIGGRVPGNGRYEVTLTKDGATNRILAVGSPRILDDLEGLIASLDIQRPQVLVEVLVVALNESQTESLSVEMQKLASWNGTLFRFSSLFSAGAPSAGGGILSVPTGTGLETVILDPGSFSAVLRALETINEGRALSIPKLLVNNDQTATLDSVLQQPYTSVNASNTVSTTSFGGTLDAGTVVTITPQITDGDQLIVEYSVSLSSFTGDTIDPAVPPPRQENRIGSVATIPDGYAVVVGGLATETVGEQVSQTPILGSIPLLGALFRSRSESTTRTNLFVFIRCGVLRDPQFEDLRYFSKRDLKTAGFEDELPHLEPRIIW